MNQEYSAVIIAKNEERTIMSCIEALKKVTRDIIVVLDDRSDDNTATLAESLGAKIYKKPWEGYSTNKNFGIQKATNDWILCLDADEILNDTLIHALKQLKAKENQAYEMNIRTWFGNYPVNHCGWFPDWNIRLFNRKVMKWNGSFVHEKLESDHPISKQRVEGIIEHYSFRDEKHMAEKFDYYAKMRADEWKKSGKKPSMIKYWFGPAFRFFRTFVLKLGFLDGKIGLTIAKNEYNLKKREWQYYLGITEMSQV
jgi:glycosyltransferase involved in cell wall biosynthesis